MSKGKSEFKFTINADPTMVEAVIRNYLVVNKYGPVPKPGANYYLSTDFLNGNRSMEYYINGAEVTILAYMGTFEKPQNLEGFVGALPKQAFRSDLNPLFEELKKLEYAGNVQHYAAPPYTAQPNPAAPPYAAQPNPAAPPYAAQPNPVTPPYAAQPNPVAPLYTAQPYANGQPVNNSLNSFVEQGNKKKETGAIVGFVLSLVGLLLSCFGIYYGVILIVLEFYLAINGIHTKKKGLAIAGIVLASLSIVILLAELALTVILAL